MRNFCGIVRFNILAAYNLNQFNLYSLIILSRLHVSKPQNSYLVDRLSKQDMLDQFRIRMIYRHNLTLLFNL